MPKLVGVFEIARETGALSRSLAPFRFHAVGHVDPHRAQTTDRRKHKEGRNERFIGDVKSFEACALVLQCNSSLVFNQSANTTTRSVLHTLTRTRAGYETKDP
jgi:hypothetical protein